MHPHPQHGVLPNVPRDGRAGMGTTSASASFSASHRDRRAFLAASAGTLEGRLVLLAVGSACLSASEHDRQVSLAAMVADGRAVIGRRALHVSILDWRALDGLRLDGHRGAPCCCRVFAPSAAQTAAQP